MAKRNRTTSDVDTSTKKFKSAKDVSTERVITVDTPEQKKNEENDAYWDLSVKRRVTVQEFKGNTLIALREYYEKDGVTLPGKQGISLTVEQFAILLKATPAIKTILADKGIQIQEEKELVDTGDEEKSGGNAAENDEDENEDEDED